MPDDEKSRPQRERLATRDHATCARHIWLYDLAHKAERLISHRHTPDDDHRHRTLHTALTLGVTRYDSSRRTRRLD
jgi:hypothetical protein